VAILKPVKARLSSGRAQQGLDSVTSALIRRLSKVSGQKMTPPVAGPDKMQTGATRETTKTAEVSGAASPDKPSKGNGVRILNLKNAAAGRRTPVSNLGNAKTALKAATAENPRLAALDPKAGPGADKPADRQATAEVKQDPHPRMRQTAAEIKVTAIEGESQAARKSDTAHPGNRVNRPVAAEANSQTVVAKSTAAKADLPKVPVVNNDQPVTSKPAAAVNVSRSGQADGSTATVAPRPAATRANAAPAPLATRQTATVVSTTQEPQSAAGTQRAEPALQSTPLEVETAKAMPAGGSKNIPAASPHVLQGHNEDRLNLKTPHTVRKTAAAPESKKAAKAAFHVGDRETSGSDSTYGQTVREARGGEQTRIDLVEPKIKPAEPAATAPKAQSAAPATATPETEKTVLDRVSEARVLEQISSRIRLQPKNGGNEIRMQLKPETLGQMQLKVLAQDQTISVKMVAETAMARDIIENNIGQLRADLNALGLNVEKLDVEVLATGDPAEKDAAGQRGGFAKHGRGTAQHGGRDHAPGDDRARQMQAEEDEDAEGTLVGVFA